MRAGRKALCEPFPNVALDTVGAGFYALVLPYPKSLPTGVREPSVRLPVPTDVRVDLLSPEP